MALNKYDWIIALITIAFCASSFGNGANDVANSYATSVAAQTLTMPQVGVLAAITEFVGAVGLGSRVTSTIKNGIIDISRFESQPATLILTMGCAEFGSAAWLLTATRLGFPVSTTQTVVGALVGAGLAAQADVTWNWEKGSVTQVAASWGIAPAIAACLAAILFGTLKYSVLERRDPFTWGMRLIPFYLAFTASILALFIVVEAPTAPSLEEFGAGKAVGIILGVFVGVLALAYIFFVPYFKARLVKNDPRIQFWHIPLGPLLMRENPPLYFAGKTEGDAYKDYYSSSNTTEESILQPSQNGKEFDSSAMEKGDASPEIHARPTSKVHLEPEERFLAPNRHRSIVHPRRLWGMVKYILLQGVTRDCVSHNAKELYGVHQLARRYDNRVEHLWTYAQVASAMIMSIAHGSNDVANAVGPWAAAYATWRDGEVATKSPTPAWILAVAGILLGAGFWFFGFHIIRALGNRITQLSPTRGYSMELGAAMTVLMASRLGLPVSTTQCLTGATLGVALMNYDLGAVNWKQLLYILCGWILTLPMAGLIAGILLLMALNTPHF